MSEVKLRLLLNLADVSESKFDVGNLLRRGFTSGDLYLDLIDIDHDSPARTDKAREVE